MADAKVDNSGAGDLPVISIVDDDASIRRALARLIHPTGLPVETFTSAEEYLSSTGSIARGCLVLDIQLNGMSGLDLFEQLVSAGQAPPVVIITAHDTPQARERAKEFGAVAFIAKPFDASAMLEAIGHAVGRDLAW